MADSRLPEAPAKEAGRTIGEVLLARGAITEEQLQTALGAQRQSKEAIGKVLVRLGYTTEQAIRDVIADIIAGPTERVDLTNALVDPDAVRRVPEELARRCGIAPLSLDKQQGQLTLVCHESSNLPSEAELERHLSRIWVDLVMAKRSAVEAFIEQCYAWLAADPQGPVAPASSAVICWPWGEETEVFWTYSIGRAPPCLVWSRLRQEGFDVAAQHADLVLEDDGTLWLIDLGSPGGTWRNGTRIGAKQRLRLEDGDRVQFGSKLRVTVHLRPWPRSDASTGSCT